MITVVGEMQEAHLALLLTLHEAASAQRSFASMCVYWCHVYFKDKLLGTLTVILTHIHWSATKLNPLTGDVSGIEHLCSAENL